MEKLGSFHHCPNIISGPVSGFRYLFSVTWLFTCFTLKNRDPGAVVPTHRSFFSCFTRCMRRLRSGGLVHPVLTGARTLPQSHWQASSSNTRKADEF